MCCLPGYAILGDVGVPGWGEQPKHAVRVYKDDAASRAMPGANPRLAFPDGYMLVYRDSGVATGNRVSSRATCLAAAAPTWLMPLWCWFTAVQR